MTSGQSSMSDAELARLDIAAMLAEGLSGTNEDARRRLFGVGAVGAAVVLDRIGTIPRSLTFLAEIVRAGGARYAAGLAEPLPAPAQTDTIRPWLTSATEIAFTVSTDDNLARWLGTVATVLALRITARGQQLPPRIAGALE